MSLADTRCNDCGRYRSCIPPLSATLFTAAAVARVVVIAAYGVTTIVGCCCCCCRPYRTQTVALVRVVTDYRRRLYLLLPPLLLSGCRRTVHSTAFSIVSIVMMTMVMMTMKRSREGHRSVSWSIFEWRLRHDSAVAAVHDVAERCRIMQDKKTSAIIATSKDPLSPSPFHPEQRHIYTRTYDDYDDAYYYYLIY